MQKGASFKEREIFRNPLSKEEIRNLLKGRPLVEFFSWRSPRAKALGLVGKERSDDDMINLMSEESALIRRPLIVIGDEIVVGMDAEKLSDLL